MNLCNDETKSISSFADITVKKFAERCIPHVLNSGDVDENSSCCGIFNCGKGIFSFNLAHSTTKTKSHIVDSPPPHVRTHCCSSKHFNTYYLLTSSWRTASPAMHAKWRSQQRTPLEVINWICWMWIHFRVNLEYHTNEQVICHSYLFIPKMLWLRNAHMRPCVPMSTNELDGEVVWAESHNKC